MPNHSVLTSPCSTARQLVSGLVFSPLPWLRQSPGHQIKCKGKVCVPSRSHAAGPALPRDKGCSRASEATSGGFCLRHVVPSIF